MMYLDLAEIDEVLSLSKLWSRKKMSPARYCRTDYFQANTSGFVDSDTHESPALESNSKSADLDSSVRAAVYSELDFYPTGPIRLLTNLRYFGYCINPISCYYCFSADEPTERLEAILIEVTNTPWGEKTHYVLDLRNHSLKNRIDFQKTMHVSPFMSMNMTYQWSGKVPGNALMYSLTNVPKNTLASDSAEVKMFDAGVNFKRMEITRNNLNKIILRYPLMTAKVALSIYWQALRLALKRVSFVPHPKAG